MKETKMTDPKDTKPPEPRSFPPRLIVLGRAHCPTAWPVGTDLSFLSEEQRAKLIEYVSKEERDADVAAARAEARLSATDELMLAVDRKLQSIMAGNYSFLVDSYRRQISEVFENARLPGKGVERPGEEK